MNKISILNKWYKCINNNEKSLQKLLGEYYSINNNLKLIYLNLIDNIDEKYYWYICNKTSEIYLFNLVINDNNYNIKKRKYSNLDNDLNIEEILTKLNRFTFTQININIIKSDIELKKKFIYIMKFNNIFYNIENITNTLNKKLDYMKNIDTVKLKKILDNMISGSSIRNYMLEDPLLDYYKEYNNGFNNEYNNIIPNKKIKNNNLNENDYNFSIKYIMNSGIEFEDELFNIISKEHKIVKVATSYTDSRLDSKFRETIKYMKQGIPIIYQGVLHNKINNTFGLPDLLVRSDYINILMNNEIISKEEASIPSKKLKTKYHYKVIDIKHSTINLRADNIHILNSESIPAYKGQLYIYMSALNNILGIDIKKAFIWGKKYDYCNKGKKIEICQFLNKLGVIDYNNIDAEFITFTNNAIEWIKILKLEGHKWKLLPIPSCYELYPNMKNEKDGSYKSIKNKYGTDIYEITNIWNCGVKKRQIAHSNNIYKWNDPLCTAEKLGFNKNKISNIIDKILDINRQNIDIIRPNSILYDRNNWDNPDPNILEFYLDFETLNSNVGSIIKDGNILYNTNQYIFMIGLGYLDNNNWKFKTFILDKKTQYSENTMFDKFFAYVNYLLRINNKKIAKFYHWSYAEPICYNKFKSRCYPAKVKDNHFIFYDLNNIFISEPITIKGVLDFSLKNVAKALFNYGLILSNWNISSPCANGLSAMILANEIYDKNIKNINENSNMKDIIYYNEIDCKVIMEIHNLIKKKF